MSLTHWLIVALMVIVWSLLHGIENQLSELNMKLSDLAEKCVGPKGLVAAINEIQSDVGLITGHFVNIPSDHEEG